MSDNEYGSNEEVKLHEEEAEQSVEEMTREQLLDFPNFHDLEDEKYDEVADFSSPHELSRLDLYDMASIGFNTDAEEAIGFAKHPDFVEERADAFRKVAEQPNMHDAISQGTNPYRFFKYYRDRVTNEGIMPEDEHKRFSAFEKADLLTFLFTRPEFQLTQAQKPIYFWDHPSNFAQKLPHLSVNETLLQRQLYRFYAFQSLMLFGLEEAVVRRLKNIVALQQATGQSYEDARRRDIPWYSGWLFSGLEKLSRFGGMILADTLFSKFISPFSPAHRVLSSLTVTLLSHPFMVLHTRSLFPYGRRLGGRDLYAGIGPRLMAAWIRGLVQTRSDAMPLFTSGIASVSLATVDFITDSISRRQQAAEVSKEFEPVGWADVVLERFLHGEKGMVDLFGSGILLGLTTLTVGACLSIAQFSGLNAALYPARITDERGRRHASSVLRNYEWQTTLG